MTVHWNARKGFQTEPNGVSKAGTHFGDGVDDLTMAELLLAMRKVPDTRSSVINRARKLWLTPSILRQRC